MLRRSHPLFAALALLGVSQSAMCLTAGTVEIRQAEDSGNVQLAFEHANAYAAERGAIGRAWAEARMLRSDEVPYPTPMPPRLVVRRSIPTEDVRVLKRDEKGRRWVIAASCEMDLADFRHTYGVHRGTFEFSISVEIVNRKWQANRQVFTATAKATVRTLSEDQVAWWKEWDYALRDPVGILPKQEAGKELRSWITRAPRDDYLIVHAVWRLLSLGERLSAGEKREFFATLKEGRSGPVGYNRKAHEAILAMGREAEQELLAAYREPASWPIGYLSKLGGELTAKTLERRITDGGWIEGQGYVLYARLVGERAADLLAPTLVIEEGNPEVKLNAAWYVATAEARHEVTMKVIRHWHALGKATMYYDRAKRRAQNLVPDLLSEDDVPAVASLLHYHRYEPVQVAAMKLVESGHSFAVIAVAERLNDPGLDKAGGLRGGDPKPEDFLRALWQADDRGLRIGEVRQAIENLVLPSPGPDVKPYDRQTAEAVRLLHAALLARIDSEANRDRVREIASSAGKIEIYGARAEHWECVINGLADHRERLERLLVDLLGTDNRRARMNAVRTLDLLDSDAGLDAIANRLARAADDEAAIADRLLLEESLYVARRVHLDRIESFVELFGAEGPYPYPAFESPQGDLASLAEEVAASARRGGLSREALLDHYMEVVRRRDATAGRGPHPRPDPAAVLAFRDHDPDLIAQMLHHENPEVRELGCRLAGVAFARYGKASHKLIPLLIGLCMDETGKVRLEATWSLLAVRHDSDTERVAYGEVRRRLRDPDETMAKEALRRVQRATWRARQAAWACRDVLASLGVIIEREVLPPSAKYARYPTAFEATEILLGASAADLEGERRWDYSHHVEGIVEALQQYGCVETHRPLLQRLALAPEVRLRRMLGSALSRAFAGSGERVPVPGWACDVCTTLLEDNDKEVRVYAARIFENAADPRAVPLLIKLLETAPEDDGASGEAIRYALALGRQRDPSAIPALIRGLRSGRGPYGCAKALAALGDESAVPALCDCLKRYSKTHIRKEILLALVMLGDNEVAMDACAVLARELPEWQYRDIRRFARLCPDLLRHSLLVEHAASGGDTRRQHLLEWKLSEINGPWSFAAQCEAVRVGLPGSSRAHRGERAVNVGGVYFQHGVTHMLKWFHLVRGRTPEELRAVGK